VNAIHEQSTAHMVGLPASQNWLGGGGARRRAARDPASWSTCLWGGLFNPIIPIEDRDFSDKLIRTFGVDVLIPVAATAFVDAYPHLHLRMWGGGVFKDRRSEFVDIRHAVRRAASARAPLKLSAFVRPIWLPDDPMSAMLSALFGRYPSPEEITLNYVAGIRSLLAMLDRPIDQDDAIPAELSGAISPIDFTAFDLSWRHEWHGWLDPGIVLGDATDFDDLLLFWNLRAAGVTMSFFDRTRAARCKPFVDAFLASLREQVGDEHRRINFWGRGLAPAWNPESTGFHISGLEPCIYGSDHAALWNGRNIRPRRPHFSTSHHDVVASYTDGDTGATASFGFPDRPFDDEDPEALNQHFVVTVDANQYGPRRGFGHLTLAIVSHGLARKCSLDAWRHDRGHASVAAGRAAGKSRRRRTARRPARPVAIRKAGDQASGALARMAPLAASTPSSLGNSASSPSCSRVVASLVARHLLLRPEVAAACWARLGVCSRDERSVY
jgi:hypothetical protein